VKLIKVNESHLKNIWPISFRFFVSKLDKSIDFNEEHEENKPFILITFFKFKFNKLT